MKRLLKSMSIYGIGGVLSRFTQFLLLPLYTRVLRPADYGSLEVVSMVGSIIAILYGLMIGSGFVRYYYEQQDDRYRKTLFSSAVWFTFSSSLVLAAAIMIFSRGISAVFLDFENGARYLKIVTLSTFIAAHNQVFYNHVMVQERERRYVTIGFLGLLTTMTCAIVFLVGLGWSVEGILLAQLAGAAVEFVLLFASVTGKDFSLFSTARVGEMLRYSLPLIPLQIASFVIELSDRFFLQRYQDLHDVGLYSLGYKFAALVPLLAIQPLRGFTPYIFGMISTPQRCRQTLADFSRYFVCVVLLLILAIAMFSRDVIAVMADPSYHESWRVVFILCLSYFLYGLVVLASYAIEIVKKNWISGMFWGVAAVVNVGLNIVLIPVHGIMGAAIATVVSYLMILVGYYWAVSRLYPVPYTYGKYLAVLILVCCAYGLSTLIHAGPAWSVLIKTVILAATGAAMVSGGYFTHDERSRMMEEAKAFWRRAAWSGH